MGKKLLSICIPTWNREKELSRLLRNISEEAKGLEAKIQVCISDNGSTDGTRKMLEGKWKDAPFQTKFRFGEKNVGFDLNVFNVFEMGDGEWLWLLGDDDIILKGMLGKLVGKLEGESKKGSKIVFANYEYGDINEDGSYEISKKSTFDEFFSKGAGRPGYFFYNPAWYISCIILNKEKYDSIDKKLLSRMTGNVEMHMWAQRLICMKHPDSPIGYLREPVVLDTEKEKYVKFKEQIIYSRSTNRNYWSFISANLGNPELYSKYPRMILKWAKTLFFPSFHIFSERVFRPDSKEEVELAFFLHEFWAPCGLDHYLWREFIWMVPHGVAHSLYAIFVRGGYGTWEKYWRQKGEVVEGRPWV
jgi:glycosyltransferase involved in cell wall biosynthesis